MVQNNSIADTNTTLLLSDILQSSKMSVRAFNICKSLGLETVSDLCYYVRKYGDFKKCRNCGEKTNNELLDLSEKYNCRKLPNELETKIRICSLARKKHKQLSKKAQNTLDTLMEGDVFHWGKIKKLIFEYDSGLLNLKADGKTLTELKKYFHFLKTNYANSK